MGEMKNHSLPTAARTVATRPGPRPPYHELTATAAKKSGAPAGWSSGHRIAVSRPARTTAATATT